MCSHLFSFFFLIFRVHCDESCHKNLKKKQSSIARWLFSVGMDNNNNEKRRFSLLCWVRCFSISNVFASMYLHMFVSVTICFGCVAPCLCRRKKWQCMYRVNFCFYEILFCNSLIRFVFFAIYLKLAKLRNVKMSPRMVCCSKYKTKNNKEI